MEWRKIRDYYGNPAWESDSPFWIRLRLWESEEEKAHPTFHHGKWDCHVCYEDNSEPDEYMCMNLFDSLDFETVERAQQFVEGLLSDEIIKKLIETGIRAWEKTRQGPVEI